MAAEHGALRRGVLSDAWVLFACQHTDLAVQCSLGGWKQVFACRIDACMPQTGCCMKSQVIFVVHTTLCCPMLCCVSRAKLSGWVGERIRDININDGAEEYGQQYGQQQQPPRSYSPGREQVSHYRAVVALSCTFAMHATHMAHQPVDSSQQPHYSVIAGIGSLHFLCCAPRP